MSYERKIHERKWGAENDDHILVKEPIELMLPCKISKEVIDDARRHGNHVNLSLLDMLEYPDKTMQGILDDWNYRFSMNNNTLDDYPFNVISMGVVNHSHNDPVMQGTHYITPCLNSFELGNVFPHMNHAQGKQVLIDHERPREYYNGKVYNTGIHSSKSSQYRNLFDDETQLIPGNHPVVGYAGEDDYDKGDMRKYMLPSAFIDEKSNQSNYNNVSVETLLQPMGDHNDMRDVDYVVMDTRSYVSSLFPDENENEDSTIRVNLPLFSNRVAMHQRDLLSARPATFESLSFDHGFSYIRTPVAVTFVLHLVVQVWVQDYGDEFTAPYNNQSKFTRSLIKK